MNGENGHLQRLTDEQVASRLRAYSDGGKFQDSLRWLWGQAGDVIEECSRRHFGEEAVKLNRAYFTKSVDESWVRTVAERGVDMHVKRKSVPEFVAAHNNLARDVIAEFEDRFEGKTEDKLVANIKAFADAVQKAKPPGAKGHYINRVVISSTMGPGVKVEPSSLFGEA